MFQEKVYTTTKIDGGEKEREHPQKTTLDLSKWDALKSQNLDVSEFFEKNGMLRYAERTLNCAAYLESEKMISRSTGEITYKTHATEHCRIRHCPICARIRMLKMLTKFNERVLPVVQSKYKNSRWIFLTLTVPNCPVSELSKTLEKMNKAWHSFVKRKELKPVQGWIRSTEVTQEKNRKMYAHPHFHVLMMVRPDMFTRNYVTHARWAEMWKEVMGLEETPIVHVQTVKGLEGGMLEVFKTFTYSIKVEEINQDPEWFCEYVKQVKKKRFLATGGILKELLKNVESEEDADEGSQENEATGEKTFSKIHVPTRKYEIGIERTEVGKPLRTKIHAN